MTEYEVSKTGLPAERLLAAADLLDKRASEATGGAWRRHDTHLNLGGHTATVLSGTGDATELRAWLPTMSNEPWNAQRNVWADAAYIATMHPEVGKMIAAWLRSEGDAATELGQQEGFVNGHALNLADLLLAGES